MAARGLDIPEVKWQLIVSNSSQLTANHWFFYAPQIGLVINFDLPSTAEDYVHRGGRAGRLGREGVPRVFECMPVPPLLTCFLAISQPHLTK